MTPSSLTDVLPVLACVSSGFWPIRADTSRSAVISDFVVDDKFSVLEMLDSRLLQDPQPFLWWRWRLSAPRAGIADSH